MLRIVAEPAMKMVLLYALLVKPSPNLFGGVYWDYVPHYRIPGLNHLIGDDSATRVNHYVHRMVWQHMTPIYHLHKWIDPAFFRSPACR